MFIYNGIEFAYIRNRDWGARGLGSTTERHVLQATTFLHFLVILDIFCVCKGQLTENKQWLTMSHLSTYSPILVVQCTCPINLNHKIVHLSFSSSWNMFFIRYLMFSVRDNCRNFPWGFWHLHWPPLWFVKLHRPPLRLLTLCKFSLND